MNRIRIKITGQSGSGLLSVGEIISSAIGALKYYVVTDREYPSLIKGGQSCYIINVSDKPIFSLSDGEDILVKIEKESEILKNGVKIFGGDATKMALECGGSAIMQNMVLTGMVWKILGFGLDALEKELKAKFGNVAKEMILKNLECLKKGYESVETEDGFWNLKVSGGGTRENILMDGSRAVALGAVACGVRAYFGYPMSPASNVLTYLAEMSGKTDMVVKQAEDEITAVQMSLGAMYMGARAFTATSGGGYDLMTETVSLAGIMENPLVVLIGQRPGPGTGLPTWTAQGDLNLAMHSSHGEFPRAVIGLGDAEDSFRLMAEAFNFAEKFQTPVIVLSEKNILEGKISVSRKVFEEKLKIERGLREGVIDGEMRRGERYKITESGVSPRWIPGEGNEYYFANGDEHCENGDDTEDSEKVREMYEKRMRKFSAMKEEIPAPEIFGVKKDADISFVGWGGTKNVMRDIIDLYAEKGVKVNFLHYSFVWPIEEKAVKDFFADNKNVNLIEGNYLGQFGNLLETGCGVKFKNRLLKFDGRPFFVEDLTKFIDKNLKNRANGK
ncbi:MAG: 2-oxoacid:acceptor oxidoreductase family protein [Candidatus Gracilibacteria bacterium]|jgi:2-oxoglutarate ferredoxin oxidoreductase subunit alpha